MTKPKKKLWLNFLKSRDENLTSISISKALWLLCMPISLKLLGHFLFEIIDAFWLGKLGTEVLAAVGGTSLYIWLYYSLVMTTQVGTNTLVSQRIGENDSEKACITANVGITISIVMSILFAICYWLLSEYMLSIIGLQEISLHHALQYFLPFILASPIFYLWVVFEEIINARGQTHITLIIVIFAICVNTILDPILIHGWGFDGFGVLGAQLASIIAALVGLFLTGFYCFRLEYISKLTYCHKTAKRILSIGVPRSISSSVFCLTYVGLANLIQQFGEEALAAWMISHRLEGFAYHISVAFSFALAIIVGQYFGAKKFFLAGESVRISLRYLNIIILINSACLVFFSEFFLRIFTNDPQVISFGSLYLKIVGFAHIFMGWELACGGALSGWGKTLPFLYIVAPLTIIRLPVSYLNIYYFETGITGIFWAISISTILKGSAMHWLFFRNSKKYVDLSSEKTE
ncbi:MATE family efflux transporter [Candidatus Uabimicrobium sp. HlEnr_7]|uniref:MATE family efflux transporter n=1 Tax=Candidatus Uabimicrobium helgolandensis TaxID=3095367 RepID=UPI003555C559